MYPVKIDYKEEIENYRKICDKYSEAVEKNFDDIAESVFEDIMEAVGQDNRLVSFDEKIYEYYCSLIDYYKSAAQIYKKYEDTFVSENIKKLMLGLQNVIVSQLDEFEETQKMKVCDGNPIAEEKNNIILSAKKVFLKDAEIIKKDLLADTDEINNDKINRIYCDKYAFKLYEEYKECVKKTVDMLNDIDAREVANFYYEMLKEEREILSSVVKIQIDAIEKEIQTKDEEDIIEKILFEIREGYQKICKNVDDLAQTFAGMKKKGEIKLKAEDSFKLELISDKSLEKELKEYLYKFQKGIFDRIEEISENVPKKNAQIKSIIDDTNELIKEMSEIFAEITKYTDDNRISIDEYESREIIYGVYDTIDIKIETMKEAEETFKEQSDDFIEKIGEEKPDIKENDKFNTVQRCFEAVKEGKDDVGRIIDEEIGAKITKKLDKNIELINKKVIQFIREHILFEISTFEEILNYSVSRLRDDESEVAKGYVFMIDYATMRIEDALKKKNIEIIKPKPYDIFNGKENEVLMAEKNDEFKKGQIIKVMNNGYRKDGVVIMRANVIAAR
ncbi:MAG: nucleotide exchange factor GrpE [Firmicutes bacterium]|nr:nucleotide exchange factor GrpE [Bacillota bacterium]